MTNTPRMPTRVEVFLILAMFLLVMSLSVAVFAIPLQLSLFAMWFVFIGLGIRLKYSYADLQKSIIEGISQGLEGTLVLFAVGALIGTWIAGGIVPTLIYYGLQIIEPFFFLPATVILCAVTSLAVGTSFGTVGTAGIAMLGIGDSFGVPLPLTAGAVISGAYVGDKLSPLSDTTVMTASMARLDVTAHIKGMLGITWPALAAGIVAFTLVGFFFVHENADLSRANMVTQSLQEHFNIGWYNLVPPAIVITLLGLQKPAIPVIALGALLGAAWSYLFQSSPLLEAITTAYEGFHIESSVEFLDSLLNAGGITSMLGVIALILLALGLGGLMEKIRIFEVFSRLFRRWIMRSDNEKTRNGRLSLATIIAAFCGNLFGSAAYVSLITGVKMTEGLYKEMDVDRRVLSRNTEAGGTITAPLVPWSDAGVYMTAVLGVPTLTYLPFVWVNLLGVAIAVLFGYMGYVNYKKPDTEEEEEMAENTALKKA